MSITVLTGRETELAQGLTVRRILPQAVQRAIGPFVFFDHAGPVELLGEAARGADVLPHPHIGLSTVSYLLGGAVRHRDSLGSDQVIRPGDVNWMTAGRGIVHSERFDVDGAFAAPGLELLQFWVALPEADEEVAPAFSHHAAADLPELEEGGLWLRLLAGSAFGLQSPVPTCSPMFYAHVRLKAGARVRLPAEHAERGAYVVRGSVRAEGSSGTHGRDQLLVFDRADGAVLEAVEDATVMLLGGEPLGRRFMFWNFVSSSRERIRQAADDWKAGRMVLPPNDDQEFVPLPQRRLAG